MNAGKKTIAVFGDMMLDEYVWTSVDRISPEAPVPVARIIDRTFLPGGVCNVANNLVALGYVVDVYSIGDPCDANLNQILKMFANKPVKFILASVSKTTPRKTRIMANNQQILRIDDEDISPISHMLQNLIKKSYPAVIISDYNKGTINSEIIPHLKSLCDLITVDPKVDFHKYIGANYITPNLKEYGQAPNLDNCSQMIKDLNLDGIIVTMGKDGICGVENGEMCKFPAVAQEVFDVTGAGDTVISIFTVCMMEGISFQKSIQIANIAAGIAVSKLGPTTISLETFNEIKNKIGVI